MNSDLKTFVRRVAVAAAVTIALALFAAAALGEGTEIAPNKDAPVVAGQPLTAVVITQCSGLLAVYMTMPDGRLVRFDQSSGLPVDKLLTAAYTAKRSERIEVACDKIST